jgi:hypothetical protein
MASPFVGLLVTAYLSRVDCSGSTVPRCCYKASRYAEDPYQGSSSIPASVRPPIHRPRSGRWRTASRTTNRSGLCSVPKAVSEARRPSRLRVLPARGYEYRDFRFHRRTMGGWRVLAGVTVPAPPSTRWQAKASRGVRASYLTVEELPDRRHRSHPVAPLVWTLALPGGGVRDASSRLATSSRTCARGLAIDARHQQLVVAGVAVADRGADCKLDRPR